MSHAFYVVNVARQMSYPIALPVGYLLVIPDEARYNRRLAWSTPNGGRGKFAVPTLNGEEKG
jgi:hypothetical protein